jgi:hypothetical protein
MIATAAKRLQDSSTGACPSQSVRDHQRAGISALDTRPDFRVLE